MHPKELYEILFKHFGPQHWWPGDSPFEIAVGAILTQQVAWKNVERAIGNLKKADCLCPECIADSDSLEELIRPAGFFNQKARYLKGFCLHLLDKHQGSVEKLLEQPLETARKELLQLKGIGPETADSILLYAGNHPSFVVDAYTIRVGNRMGLFSSTKYEEVKEYFEKQLEPDAELYNEYHALFVALGKDYCTARRPRCGVCAVKSGCKFGSGKE